MTKTRRMTHGIVLRLAIAFAPLLSLTTTSAQTGFRDLATSVEISGTKQIPRDLIFQQLLRLPEIVEAAHPRMDQRTYNFRVLDAVSRGYLSCGFPDYRFKADEVESMLRLQIHEGDRFRWGRVQVSGSSDEMNAKVAGRIEKLNAASDDEDDDEEPELIWRHGKPANCTPLGQFGLAQRIRTGMAELKLNAKDAKVTFARNNDQKTIDLVIQLADSDRLAMIPDAVTRPTSAADEAQPAATDSDEPPRNGIAARLASVYKENFAKPTGGFLFVHRKAATVSQIAFDQTGFYADLTTESGPAVATLALPQKFFVSFKGEETWCIPGIDFSLFNTVQSVAESENGGRMHLGFGGKVSSDLDKKEPIVRGVAFTPAAWQEWFPPDRVHIVPKENQETLVEFGPYSMRLGDNDQVLAVNLNDGDLSIHIEAIKEGTVSQISQRCVSIENARDLFPFEKDGKRISLVEVLDRTFGDSDDDDQHEFHIGPANGNKGLFAVVLLDFVNDEIFFPKDSLLAEIATLYALQWSGHVAHFSDRLAGLEPSAMRGPLTTLLLADLARGNQNWDRAEKYYSLVSLLAAENEAVDHDLNVLFDPRSLLGKIAGNMDLKGVLRLSLHVAEQMNGEESLLGQVALGTLSDAEDTQARIENGKLLAKFAFEAICRQKLDQYCESKLAQVADRKAKIAEKKKQKKEKKKR